MKVTAYYSMPDYLTQNKEGASWAQCVDSKTFHEFYTIYYKIKRKKGKKNSRFRKP